MLSTLLKKRRWRERAVLLGRNHPNVGLDSGPNILKFSPTDSALLLLWLYEKMYATILCFYSHLTRFFDLAFWRLGNASVSCLWCPIGECYLRFRWQHDARKKGGQAVISAQVCNQPTFFGPLDIGGNGCSLGGVIATDGGSRRNGIMIMVWKEGGEIYRLPSRSPHHTQ